MVITATLRSVAEQLEYKVMKVSPNKVEKTLNKLAKEGWVLVTRQEADQRTSWSSKHTLTLSRPKKT